MKYTKYLANCIPFAMNTCWSGVTAIFCPLQEAFKCLTLGALKQLMFLLKKQVTEQYRQISPLKRGDFSWPVKITLKSFWDKSIIFIRWGKTGAPQEKQPDHLQAELSLFHMRPKLGSNPQQWDDERLRALKISILNHSAMWASKGKLDQF